MKGIAHFVDGHTEEIQFAVEYEESIAIEFFTESGHYFYNEFLVSDPDSQFSHKSHKFYESILTADDFGYIHTRLIGIDTIYKVELKKED